ncbi:probable apyrase 3 isoform X1 [Physcomitrium patens]|uniref:Apyrase n=1 Tax=Physcomitrium patens TaxID=3218 RepID=A0A7I4FDE4_PHYPA|nr:probable apyrase 6 isoform X1 [Physcomitrium patens]XP_024358024.1 probable apyrase 6 isoform X1 [Physcomitrium patens]XP_024358025.1 probable apyrase 6 isoform X1 [Physcomitrium patens]|eukprot:XP_024358023.1 probable apyrase 6 isoform X1 [Physcomitrella patens]
MIGDGWEIGPHSSRRQSGVNSPRRLSRTLDASRDFDSFMEFPKLLQRGASLKVLSPARYQQYSNAQNVRSTCQKTAWMSLGLCLSSLLLLYFLLLRRSQYVSHRQSKGYGVIIDIGQRQQSQYSSNIEARVHIFTFEDTNALTVKVLGEKPSRVLFDESSGEYDASTSFGELLVFAKELVPELERLQTRLYVLGTGGLQWAPIAKWFELLQQCRNVFRESGFQFHDDWALVVNGRDQGVYEWVAANYAHDTLKSDSADTIGVLSLGSESAQVTFIAEVTPPPAYLYKIELWGTTHELYSYNFEKLGLESASDGLLKLLHAKEVASSVGPTDNIVVVDPCQPTGFEADANYLKTPARDFLIMPTGNFTACRAESHALLHQGRGILVHDEAIDSNQLLWQLFKFGDACLDSNCPIETTFVPDLRGNFIATGYFYQTSKLLEATGSLAELVVAGERYCSAGQNSKRNICFSAAYIVAFLHDSLGLPDHGNKVLFTDSVNSVPVEWTLGFFISRLSEDKAAYSPLILFEGFFGIVLLFLGLLATGSLIFWFVTRLRRPQHKTIYDLEKGRYFTTAARGR